jgi:hypothetical protein
MLPQALSTPIRRSRALLGAGLLAAGACLTLALSGGGPAVAAQTLPTPTPLRLTLATPTPFRVSSVSTTSTTAPRAGELPTDLALPLLVGGAAALGGGMYLLRRRPQV